MTMFVPEAEVSMERAPQLEDFYHLFSHKIYCRAKTYYDAGTVQDISQETPNLWHARVLGSNQYYDVNVRIHRSRVTSAACTCPYGQQHTYCKHVGATLFTIKAQNEAVEDSKFPHDASSAVARYWNSQFCGEFKHNAAKRELPIEDWKAIKHILEVAYDLPDIESGLEQIFDRHWLNSEKISPKENLQMHMRPMTPRKLHEQQIEELPHGWLTLLEAAYEHLEDREGLRRLYVLYIFMARSLPESVYVRKLREISGGHWQENRDAIISYAHMYKYRMAHGNDNPAYERFLIEEHLPQAADEYCVFSRSDNRLLRMLDLVAEANPDRCKKFVFDMLMQPDSRIYQGEPKQSAIRVGTWIRRINEVFGEAEACNLSRHITQMFPKREHLHNELAEYLDEMPRADEQNEEDGTDV